MKSWSHHHILSDKFESDKFALDKSFLINYVDIVSFNKKPGNLILSLFSLTIQNVHVDSYYLLYSAY